MNEQRKDLRGHVLRFVELFVERNGYPPTYQEIMESVGLRTKSHVDYYLQALEAEGRIARKPGSPRSLRPLAPEPRTVRVPLAGTVTPDRRVAWGSAAGSTIEVTASMAGPATDLYALRVQGDSLLDELVGHGDILIVERRSWALSGEVAVVCAQGRTDARLTRLKAEAARGRSSRTRFGALPIVMDATEMQIDGGLVAVIRQP